MAAWALAIVRVDQLRRVFWCGMQGQPIFRTSSRSDNGIFLTRHQGALDSTSPAFGAISVKIAG